MLRLTPFLLNKFPIANPLSAITESPGSSKSRIPQDLVISLSEIDPVKRAETNETAQCGVIPIEPFSVVWDLYGNIIWTAKASMMVSEHEFLCNRLLHEWRDKECATHVAFFPLCPP